MADEVLPGLPGAGGDPGTGAAEFACFEQVLTDTGGPGPHVQHRLESYADVVGPLVVAAGGLEPFRAALPAGAHAVRVLLVADAADPRDGLATVREARNGLFDDDRVEIVGVQLALPGSGPLPGPDPGSAAGSPGTDGTDLAAAAGALLAALDFTAQGWIEIPLATGWQRALEVVARDGSEHVAVRATAGPDDLAAFVRRAVDLDLTFRVSGDVAGAVRGPHPGSGAPSHGLLNLLCGVRAALNGAETEQIGAVLACTEHAPLAAATRRMSAADAAVCRAFLTSVDTADVGGTVADLLALGLL